jgi:type VI protein secretion system component Hcp
MSYGDAGEQVYLKIELEPVTGTRVGATYFLDSGFLGGVTVGAHAGWSKLETFEFSQWRPVDGAQADGAPNAPGINEIVVTKVTDCTSPLFFKVCATGRHVVAGKPVNLTVKLDVTRADGNGRETTVLSVTLHDVVIARDTTTPLRGGVSAATERFRLRYRRMTRSSLPRWSPDVSHVVRDAWLRGVSQTLI